MENHLAVSPRRAPSPTIGSDRYLSWGRYPRVKHEHVHRPAWNDQLGEILRSAPSASVLPYGLGRSYGDSCLNSGRRLIDCRRLNRFLAFDENRGVLRCESGATLSDIIDTFLPKGWFLPVTPGTSFVTVGGAIANDVHGKNHHRAGTFGGNVLGLGLERSDYGLVVCNAQQNSDMFSATVGGLGLTGLIAWADIQLKRVPGPWIEVEVVPFRSLEAFLDLSAESDVDFEYTVAWVDCFAGRDTRGILLRGNHSEEQRRFRAKRGPTVPFAFPKWILNSFVVKAFNACYFHSHCLRKKSSLAPYDSFFYPLDSIHHWNLMYGKHGFVQYQCVLPTASLDALKDLFDRIAVSGMGSSLGVLKKFGSVPPSGMLSFPRPGLTLALDFAMRGRRTLALLETLDEIVRGAGGALYPAKDARMSPAMFESSFPNWRRFVPYIDPKMSSSFWRRVTETQC